MEKDTKIVAAACLDEQQHVVPSFLTWRLPLLAPTSQSKILHDTTCFYQNGPSCTTLISFSPTPTALLISSAVASLMQSPTRSQCCRHRTTLAAHDEIDSALVSFLSNLSIPNLVPRTYIGSSVRIARSISTPGWLRMSQRQWKMALATAKQTPWL